MLRASTGFPLQLHSSAMKKFISTGWLFLFAAFCPGHGVSGATINVFAAASLTESLKLIAADYERQTGDKVLFNFGASSFLARQIEEGAPADIFFSADEARMES